ncbi:hypothetical protein ON05_036205 (plasmid) [Acaryochloris sp. CCMEE 5410]|nr:hypothetical protein ON05_036205 [Acaryochloris sp. CCMEE 5410]
MHQLSPCDWFNAIEASCFIYCTWQSDLLPNPEYRQIWKQLKAQLTWSRLPKSSLKVSILLQFKIRAGRSSILTAATPGVQSHPQSPEKQFEPPQMKQVPDLSIEQHSLDLYDNSSLLLSPR